MELRNRMKAIVDYHAKNSEDYAEARKLTVNECTFTLFNRLAALKVMEDKGFFPEIINRRVENAGRSYEHNAWLEENPDGRTEERDGLVEFLSTIFERESKKFPIFSSAYPYSIMPRADELNEIIEAFNAVSADPDCGEDIWREDDILGWLYENFNAVEKAQLKEDGGKTEYDKVSLQSQVYTPQWVVKFLVDNTVGKMYLEMHPDSDIDRKIDETGEIKYRIANRPKEKTRKDKDLRKWRIIDPACGSGNFLIYTMSLLYDLYMDQAENFGADYSKRDIPAMIIENNLYGVDLDERAVQLSQIALRIKARELAGKRGKSPSKTNVVCSNFILPDYEQVRHMVEWSDWDKQKADTVEKVWNDLAEASKFGSLVRVEQPLRELVESQSIAKEGLFAGQDETSLFNFRRNAIDSIREQFHRYVTTDSFTSTKVEDALTFLNILSIPFDVAVANPPYTDSGDFGPKLKTFVEDNYKKPYKFHTNLYAAFILRCWELTSDTGKIGMIHPMTFMYIKSFEDVRRFILEKTHIDIFVEYGLDRISMFKGTGYASAPAFYILSKSASKDYSIFFDIDTRLQEKDKKETLLNLYSHFIDGETRPRVYTIFQSELKGIKSWPFNYYLSQSLRDKYVKSPLSNVAKVISGIKTGNNESTLRHWWEVSEKPNKWAPYTKGGTSTKWYGNIWLKVLIENDFNRIKSHSTYNIPSIKFVQGITYNGLGSRALPFRLLEADTLFDMGSSALFPSNVILSLAFLNSKLTSYAVRSLNPTVNVQPSDVNRLPFVEFDTISQSKRNLLTLTVQQIIGIKKHLCKFSLIEPLFEQSPIQPGNISVKECVATYYNYENGLLTQVLLNEAIINREVFDIYDISENDRKMVLDKEGIPIGDLSVSEIARNHYLQFLQLPKDQFPASDELIAHINTLPLSDEQPRLEFERLYQKNYEWEEFCIKNNVNPIEAWYQFSIAHTLPAQRTQILAFELITDVIRTLLEKDDDGVMPLVDRTGEGLVTDRIQQEMIERGYTGTQFSQVVQLLGMPLDRYLRDKFFQQLSDHLNLFMYLPKTPFIWHLTSGPLHAMELYVSIYKWNRNTLSRVKSVYCANRESGLRDRLATLAQSNDSAAQSEAADIRAQLRELAEFVEKLDVLLASGYDPKLDDGVGKNIAPLQKAGLLSYAVLKETGGKKSQLNKFLNADW
ncbi:MAG: N-6 DNA methylase [Muribaculaceae bacterium]|nr:N-6 DNA methylase [Muribaculaceae bacterium]